MSRYHIYRPITDAQGNLRAGATVRLIDPDTNNSMTTSAYDSQTGVTPLDNPFVTASGIVDLYFDDPVQVSFGIVPVGGVQETVVGPFSPDGSLQAAALRTTDANAFYTDTQPLRATITTDPQRRVRWIGPFQPSTADGYAIDGLDVWERTT